MADGGTPFSTYYETETTITETDPGETRIGWVVGYDLPLVVRPGSGDLMTVLVGVA